MTGCKKCGMCCKTVGVELPTPETEDDFEDIKWYLDHQKMTVYIDRDGTWNLEMQSKCKHLGKNNACEIYESRPPICRSFDPAMCDVCEDEEDVIEFTTHEDVDDYVAELKENGDL